MVAFVVFVFGLCFLGFCVFSLVLVIVLVLLIVAIAESEKEK